MINNSRNGFIIVELLIVTMILAIVIGSINGIFIAALKHFNYGSDIIDSQQNGRIALAMIERDVKNAECIINSSTSSNIRIRLAGREIRYYRNGSQILKSVALEGNNPVAYNVEKLEFEYFPSVEDCSLVVILLEISCGTGCYSLSSGVNIRSLNF